MRAIARSPLVIVAAAAITLSYEIALWCTLPPDRAPAWMIGMHAALVALVAAAACWVARRIQGDVVDLERVVADRTHALDERNRDLRRILDTVRDGFLSIDRDARPSAERSAAFDRWFGPAQPEETLFDRLALHAPRFATTSRVCWEQVKDGVLPLDAALDQMPSEVRVGARSFRVTYAPIGEGEAPERFLVVVADVTDEVERARAEEERREALDVFDRILADRAGFDDFWGEASRLVHAITARATDDVTVLRRVVHTLKGSSALFGLASVAAICHRLEAHLVDERSLPPHVELAALDARWVRLSRDVGKITGARPRTIEVDESQHAALEHALRQRAPHDAILQMVRALKLEPTRRRLDAFAEQARAIAMRLGKGDVDVRVDDGALRVDGKRWAPFWTALVHAVRNAVDHGLEPRAGDREACGKPARGRITLRTAVEGARFVVEVKDDGRGVDWTAVARLALDRHLPAWKESDLVAALFDDGVSTSTELTDVSGRGIGMGALRAAAEALGGVVEVESVERRGTTVRATFPIESMTGAPPWPLTLRSSDLPRVA